MFKDNEILRKLDVILKYLVQKSDYEVLEKIAQQYLEGQREFRQTLGNISSMIDILRMDVNAIKVNRVLPPENKYSTYEEMEKNPKLRKQGRKELLALVKGWTKYKKSKEKTNDQSRKNKKSVSKTRITGRSSRSGKGV